MIWSTDVNGSAIYVCPEWAIFTGQDIEDALGFGWLDMLHPDDRSSARDVVAAACAAVATFSMRYRLKRRDASFAPIIAGAVPSRSPLDQQFIGFIGSAIEVPDGYEAIEAGAFTAKLIVPPASVTSTAVTKLDMVAEHILLARAIADEDNEAAICAALDFALSLLFIQQGADHPARH